MPLVDVSGTMWGEIPPPSGPGSPLCRFGEERPGLLPPLEMIEVDRMYSVESGRYDNCHMDQNGLRSEA